MLTACVRDLKKSHPQISVNVKTSASELWRDNPYLDRTINEGNADRVVQMHYPLVHQSTLGAYHFIHGFRLYLEEQLNLRIPAGEFRVDVHISQQEHMSFPLPNLVNWRTGRPTWIVDAGHKLDYTCKMWEFDRYQQVVNATRDRINWVQIGAGNHPHKPLDNAVNLIGKTSHRQFVHLMYHSHGVLTPVSYPMHLATIPMRNHRNMRRPCIVVAGSREPAVWEKYTCHTYLENCGLLPCSYKGACWKARIERLNDGVKHDNSLCLRPITTPSGQVIPECLDLITVDEVVGKIELYLKYVDLKLD